MSNYDKPLDKIVKDQKKAKFQAKKKNQQAQAKKAKIGKGGKKPMNKQVGKNRNNLVNKRPGNNRNNNVGRNSAPMKKQMIRKNNQGPQRNFARKTIQKAVVPRAGLRSASALAKQGGISTGLKVHVDNLDWGVTVRLC